MTFFPSLSAEDIHHFHHTVTHSVAVRNHLDALVWLQGDMQHYLPHKILIAVWGDFETGTVQHDILSPLEGVRSINSRDGITTPLLLQLFTRWSEFGQRPLSIDSADHDFQLVDKLLLSELGTALLQMRCALVHGIRDERGSHDCLYALFSDHDNFTDTHRCAMDLAMPYIDMALRQIEHLPHQAFCDDAVTPPPTDRTPPQDHGLSGREVEVLNWVNLGKTNPEIGSILDISEFTVKNHLQRIFKKLDVYSRTQAVGKFNLLMANA